MRSVADSDRIVAALCYVVPVLGFFAFALESLRRSRFVRFHAAQALGYWTGALLTAVAVVVVLGLLGRDGLWLPALLPLALLVVPVIWFARALAGQWAEMPVVHDYVSRYID